MSGTRIRAGLFTLTLSTVLSACGSPGSPQDQPQTFSGRVALSLDVHGASKHTDNEAVGNVIGLEVYGSGEPLPITTETQGQVEATVQGDKTFTFTLPRLLKTPMSAMQDQVGCGDANPMLNATISDPDAQVVNVYPFITVGGEKIFLSVDGPASTAPEAYTNKHRDDGKLLYSDRAFTLKETLECTKTQTVTYDLSVVKGWNVVRSSTDTKADFSSTSVISTSSLNDVRLILVSPQW